MADATDSKSVARKGVWVQVPPPALAAAERRRSTLALSPADLEHVHHQIVELLPVLELPDQVLRHQGDR
jgi:hypothetical protein